MELYVQRLEHSIEGSTILVTLLAPLSCSIYFVVNILYLPNNRPINSGLLPVTFNFL